MPRYDGTCPKCGTIEIIKSMNDAWPKSCPQCKGDTFDREFNFQTSFHQAADSGWENENNGLGRYLPQAGPRYLDAKTKQKPNPDAYARSRSEAVDRFKKRGYPEIGFD